MSKFLVLVGFLTAGTFLVPDVAVAQRGFGFRGGGISGGGAVFRPPAGGFGGGLRGGIVSAPGWGGGFRGGAIAGRPGFGYRPTAIYRPGYGGFYRPDYGYYRPYYRRNYGGAVAAGLIGGLAVGAALSSPYYYGYPYNYPYYGVSATYEENCFWERRRVVGPRGRIIIRRAQVCYY